MSEFYTDTAKQVQESIDGTACPRVSGRDVCGNLLLARGTYTVGAGVAVGDTIKVARLPKGAVMLPALSGVTTEALGAAFTVKLGTTTTTDRYAATLDLKTASAVDIKGGTEGAALAPLDDSEWVIATVTAVTTATVGKRATFCIAYVTL